MHVKKLSTAVMAIAISTCTFAVQANGNNWSPNQPTNSYWQTPNWGGFNMPSYNTGPNNYNRPPPGYYGAPNNQRPNFQGPNNRGPNYSNQNMRPAPNMQRPANPNMNRPPQNMAPPPPNMNRGYPPPQGPYNNNSNGRSYNDNGASAYNMPGYNRYRNNNGWNNNKLWGRSGPGTWTNPNKNNMENAWDDMINTPSRMGEMPGGWTAPEVTMPNPIDMGDQMQDNLQDLPDQMRDGNIGNNVSN